MPARIAVAKMEFVILDDAAHHVADRDDAQDFVIDHYRQM